MHTRTFHFCTEHKSSLSKVDSCRWRSDVSTYPDLDSQTEIGPVYTYEYNTRETYGGTILDWTANDPLNATWWHRVTEGMNIH